MLLCQNLGVYAPSAVLMELENFNTGFLRPNQEVLTQEEYVPGGGGGTNSKTRALEEQ